MKVALAIVIFIVAEGLLFLGSYYLGNDKPADEDDGGGNQS